MKFTQLRIDSITKIYNKTSKTDNIFKCNTTLQMNSDSLKLINQNFYVDENYKVINHILFDFANLILDDELNSGNMFIESYLVNHLLENQQEFPTWKVYLLI